MHETSSAATRRGGILLACAIFLWGMNWPIMKIGIGYIHPLWFAAIRVLLGALTLFIFLAFRGGNILPNRRELPILLSVGGLQIGLGMALIHSALQYVDAGRSAIIAYTMALWAAPMAAWALGEKLTPAKGAGLFMGVVGLLFLLNPLTFPWGWNTATLGNVLLLLAAISWAIAIVHVRAHAWIRGHLQLLPWQLLLGGILISITALTLDGPPHITPSWTLGAILLFNGPLATALAFWAFLAAARALTSNATAMGSLAVPVVGFAASHLLLGEPLNAPTLGGLGFIVGGIFLATIGGFKARGR